MAELKMLGFDPVLAHPWAELLDRYVANRLTWLAQQVEAAIVPHLAHLGDVTLEERVDLLYAKTVRCRQCQSATEVRSDG